MRALHPSSPHCSSRQSSTLTQPSLSRGHFPCLLIISVYAKYLRVPSLTDYELVFEALSHEARRSLVLLLGTLGGELSSGYLAARFQHISGFGGASIPGFIPDLTSSQVDTAFGTGDGQIGMTILRIRIPPDEADFRMEVPTAARAVLRGSLVYLVGVMGLLVLTAVLPRYVGG